MVQRWGDLFAYTEALGILQEYPDLMPFEQVAVHAGIVAVPLVGLFHEEVELNGRVLVLPVDMVLQQGGHYCIDTIPVGLSAIAAVAVQEEEVAQLGGMENCFPQLMDGGCVCLGGTGMDVGDVLEDGLEAFFADAGCGLGFCADVQTTLTEGFSQYVDVKVFDQDHGVFRFHCPNVFGFLGQDNMLLGRIEEVLTLSVKCLALGVLEHQDFRYVPTRDL